MSTESIEFCIFRIPPPNYLHQQNPPRADDIINMILSPPVAKKPAETRGEIGGGSGMSSKAWPRNQGQE